MHPSQSFSAAEVHLLQQRIAELEQEVRRQAAMRLVSDRARERSAVLAEISRILAEPGELRTVLQRVTVRAATRIADWVAIDLAGEQGQMWRAAVHHPDPAKLQLAHELYERYPAQPTDPVPRVIRSGQVEWIERIPAALLEVLAQDEEHLRIVRSLGLRSYVIAPLIVRGEVLGALTLVTAESTRCYTEEDVDFAQDLAGRIALVIDNKRLEARASTSERHFRELVDSLGAIIWEGDANTFLFHFVSKRAEDILGYPLERWLEPGFWASIVDPEQREWAVGYCAACTREGRDHEFEYRVIAADGRLVWLRDIVYVIPDEHGKPYRLRGLMIDITDRMNQAGIVK